MVQFTPREQDVLHLLAKTYSRKQLAEALHISHSTVDSHLYSIFKKTLIHNLLELSHYAQAHGYGKETYDKKTT